jgi:hypothetical protein
MSQTRKTPLYGNCVIEAPDGQALCRTSQKKIDWYLKRNLGYIVADNPLTLRLFFEPSGRHGAEHPYMTCRKENVCVVCGTDQDITRHHVVPRCFRKHFPDHLKNHALHDVLILCTKCHNQYEEEAFKKKQAISEQTGFPLGGRGFRVDKETMGVRAAAYALSHHYDKIPEPRREELLDRLREHFGRQDITGEDILEAEGLAYMILNGDVEPFGKLVVEQLKDIDPFIKDWRRHFVDVMKPQFLPPYWDVENNIP